MSQSGNNLAELNIIFTTGCTSQNRTLYESFDWLSDIY